MHACTDKHATVEQLHKARRGTGSALVWPAPRPAEVDSAEHLSDELASTWAHITRVLPFAAAVLSLHGRLVAFSYAEAHLGGLFGKPVAQHRFRKAMQTLSLVLWDVNVHHDNSQTYNQRIATYCDKIWPELVELSNGDPPRNPATNAVFALTESRWAMVDMRNENMCVL